MVDENYTFELETQQKILALLFQDFRYLSTVGVELIKPNYFDNPILANIARWIIIYYEEYRTRPTETMLLTELQKHNARTMMTSADYEMYEDIIRSLSTIVIEDKEFIKNEALDFAKQVNFKIAMEKLFNLYNNSKDSNFEEAESIIREALSVGAGSHLGLDLMSNLDTLPQLLKENYDTANMFSTGLDTLDDALGGGMAKGELFVFAGAPGRGKSKFLSHLAKEAIFQGKPVVYFTFEWSEKEVLSNIISCVTGMSMRDLVDPEKVELYQRRVMKLKSLAPNIRTIYYSNKTVSVSNLRTYLTKLNSIDGFKPGVIIIDYADLMLPVKQTRRSSDSMYEEMGTIFYDLKALADEFECPVITGSQLGKASWNQQDDSVNSQDMLADSSRKAHVAYGIVTLNQTREEMDAKKMRLYVAKARRGKTNTTVYIDFDKAINQIHECAEYNVKDLKPSTDKK